jgi:mannose-1-phosphate guanylyltransferase
MQRTVLIMAGGSGERFWPLSRQKRPKQLLTLTSPTKTMLDEAIERILPLIAAQHIFIVTSELLQEPIRASLRASGYAIPPENVIAEPLKRNTSPCIALGAAFIAERYSTCGSPERYIEPQTDDSHSKEPSKKPSVEPLNTEPPRTGLRPDEISMAVLTADHFISDAELFRASVDAALSHAEQTGELVTFGVTPTRPATGYGYIEVELKDRTASGVHATKAIKAHRVRSFREKPNAEIAQDFIERGNFFWNSGMFFWRVDSVIAGLREHLPEVGIRIDDLMPVLHGATRTAHDGAPQGTLEVFQHMPDISIDFGLMERAKNVACVPVSFGWDDVGSWDALERVYETDSTGNINVGDAVLLDARDCIVLNNAHNDIAIAAIGVENLVIVATGDGVLVCPKDRVQDVRKAVAALRDRHNGKFV